MPIKPENKHRYPADWQAIRGRILERAHWRCEHPGCIARQYAVGHWVRHGDGPWTWQPLEGNRPATTAQDRLFHQAGEGYHPRGHSAWNFKRARTLLDTFFLDLDDIRPTIIVLTIAHLNHTPEDCSDSNLRALCQRHHLAHDRDHHRITAWTTRRARLPQQELAF